MQRACRPPDLGGNGLIFVPNSVTSCPLTLTLPATISCSQERRPPIPAAPSPFVIVLEPLVPFANPSVDGKQAPEGKGAPACRQQPDFVFFPPEVAGKLYTEGGAHRNPATGARSIPKLTADLAD